MPASDWRLRGIPHYNRHLQKNHHYRHHDHHQATVGQICHRRVARFSSSQWSYGPGISVFTMLVISDIILPWQFCSHHHIMIIEQSAGEGDWVSSPAPWDPGRMDPGSCKTQAWNRSASAEWKCSKLKSGGGCSSCSDWSVVEKSKQSFLITNTQCFPWIKPRLRNIPGSLNCYVRPLQCIDLRSKPPHLNWTVMR